MTADLIRRLRASDPYRRGTPLPDLHGADTVLLEIERRMHMEATTIRLDDRSTASPRRTGWLRAATAFAAVIVAVGAGTFFLRDDTLPVSDGADAVVTVEGFAAAVSAGETDLSAFLTNDATYVRMQTWPIEGDLAEYWAALDTRMTLSECSAAAQLVTCEGVHTNLIYEILNRQIDGTWTFVMADGRIHRVLEDYGRDDFLADGSFPIEDYIAWLHVTRPHWLEDAEVEIVYAMGSITTLPEILLTLNAHNGALLMSHLDDYRTALAEMGLPSDDWSRNRWGPLPSG